MQVKIRCSNCGGFLFAEDDGYRKFLNCVNCATQFEMDGQPRGSSKLKLLRGWTKRKEDRVSRILFR